MKANAITGVLAATLYAVLAGTSWNAAAQGYALGFDMPQEAAAQTALPDEFEISCPPSGMYKKGQIVPTAYGLSWRLWFPFENEAYVRRWEDVWQLPPDRDDETELFCSRGRSGDIATARMTLAGDYYCRAFFTRGPRLPFYEVVDAYRFTCKRLLRNNPNSKP